MTAADCHCQPLARQQAGHSRIDMIEHYINADTAAFDEYVESGAITVVDAARAADEGEVAP